MAAGGSLQDELERMAAAAAAPGGGLGLDEEEDAAVGEGGAAGEAGRADTMVKLVSKEGHEFFVPRAAALASGTIRAMLLGPGQWKETAAEGGVPAVKFEDISSSVLERCAEYMLYKAEYESAEGAVPKFDIPLPELVPVLLAASFFDL